MNARIFACLFVGFRRASSASAAFALAVTVVACGGGSSVLTPPSPVVAATPADATNSECVGTDAQAQTVTLPSTGGISGSLAIGAATAGASGCITIAIASGAAASQTGAQAAAAIRHVASVSATATPGPAPIYDITVSGGTTLVTGATFGTANSAFAFPDGTYYGEATYAGDSAPLPQGLVFVAKGGVLTLQSTSGSSNIVLMVVPTYTLTIGIYPRGVVPVYSDATPTPAPSSATPTASPAASAAPSAAPTASATAAPTSTPTALPTATPTPTSAPSMSPVSGQCGDTNDEYWVFTAPMTCENVSSGNVPNSLAVIGNGFSAQVVFTNAWAGAGGLLGMQAGTGSPYDITPLASYPFQPICTSSSSPTANVGCRYLSFNLQNGGSGLNASPYVNVVVTQTGTTLWDPTNPTEYQDCFLDFWAGSGGGNWVTQATGAISPSNPTTVTLSFTTHGEFQPGASPIGGYTQSVYAIICGNYNIGFANPHSAGVTD